ncbi:MAG: Smr/MutS family protein, partial [Acidobacteriota bacterium]
GRSHALSVAQDRGIPAAVLERARVILGEAWERRERAETDAEQALERLRRSEQELAREREATRREAERLDGDRRKLGEERSRMLAEGLAGFERARDQLARRVDEELEGVRNQSARLAQASSQRILEEAERAAAAEDVLDQAREAQEEKSRAVEPGQRARVRGLGAEGTVVSFDGNWAHMEIQGKRLKVRRKDLEPPQKGSPKATARSRGTVSTPAPDSTGGPTPEVHVIGQRLDEAVDAVARALDQAVMAGAGRLRVIHGHGTGRLRAGIREEFRNHPSVASLRAADAREGGNGATIIELR